MQNAQQAFDAIAGDLPGGAWLMPHRLDGLAGALARGLPTRHDENWHYTDLARLLGKKPKKTKQAMLSELDIDGYPIEFRDGNFVPSLVSAPAGLDMRPLSQSLDVPIYDDLLTANIDETMVAFNLAFMRDGALLRVSAPLAAPIILTSYGSQAAHLRHIIHVEAGAALTLVEVMENTAYSNHLLDIDVAAGGHLTHIRVQTVGDVVSLTRLNLARDARVDAYQFMGGDGLARHDMRATLREQHAQFNLRCGLLGTAASHSDMTCVIDHVMPDTMSDTQLRAVLDAHMRGVFQGKIIVRPDAQHVEARQHVKAVMLDSSAEMDAKPALEIYADDVVCAHGVAIGALDSEALFYLRARGLDERQARQLIITGFMHSMLETIADDAIRVALTNLVMRRLAQLGGAA